jgi:hypothetical protein
VFIQIVLNGSGSRISSCWVGSIIFKANSAAISRAMSGVSEPVVGQKLRLLSGFLGSGSTTCDFERVHGRRNA